MMHLRSLAKHNATTVALLLIAIGCLVPSSIRAADALPRVLILGDSIYQQPARDIAKELKGRVEIVYVNLRPGEVRNTQTALENLDRFLGDGEWDLIHFNFGLGDLVHRAPKMKAFRIMPIQIGGVRATDSNQYRRNLQLLVARLKTTGAKVVWASTTPIRHSSTNVFKMGSEIEYNTIAAEVMNKSGIQTNDMYSHVKSLIDMNRPASHGADPFFFDRKPIHKPIVEVIKTKLLKRK